MRGIRQQINTLLSGLSAHDAKAMKLGLAHSLGRYKLKMSPDKVDTMIVQAIGAYPVVVLSHLRCSWSCVCQLAHCCSFSIVSIAAALLDELDKELNTYAMRVREWYGWHFPEMTKIVLENLPYARVVKKMGIRQNAAKTDLSDCLPEDIGASCEFHLVENKIFLGLVVPEAELKQAAEISMGTEIAEEDIANVQQLADQVIAISDYRTSLFEYLRNRMNAIGTCFVFSYCRVLVN